MSFIENGCPDLFSVDNSKGKLTTAMKGFSMQRLVHSLHTFFSLESSDTSTEAAPLGHRDRA